MPSIAKPIFIITGIVAALCALAILVVNLFIQSHGVQAKLREAVFKATGSEPIIAKTYYTPWSGLTMSGIKVPQAENAKKPLLSIKSIKCRIDLLSLFRGEIIIHKIAIEEPSLLVVQGQSPIWPQSSTLPFQKIELNADKTPQTTAPSAESNQRSTTSPAATINETAARDAAQKSPARFSPVVSGTVRIHRGQALFYPAPSGRPIRLEGFVAEGQVSPAGTVAGTFRAKTISISDLILYTDFTGRFEYRDGNLKIPEMEANWAEGKLHGSLEISSGEEVAFSGSLVADHVSLQKLAEEAGFSAEGMQGTLLANATLQGIPGRPESFKGTATGNLTQARMQPIDPIRQLGEMLRINELQMLELRNSQTALTIQDGKILVDRLEMESTNLLLDANGEAEFDGTLNLAARLHVTDALLKNSFGFVGSKFQPSDREGYAHMSFSITGNISRPKSDLLDKLVGIRLGDDVGGLLKNLFRVPKKEKKKKNEPAPAATPN